MFWEVCELDHRNEYGLVPPDGVAAEEPSLAPELVSLVHATLTLSEEPTVTVTLAIPEHPLVTPVTV